MRAAARHGTARAWVAVMCGALWLVAASGARAQTGGDLTAAQRCTANGGNEATCLEAQVAGHALVGQVGLMAGLGSEVPGSASTLGRRLGTTPRVAVSLRTAFTHAGIPDLSDPDPEPSREVSYTVPAVHAGVVLGVTDGFSPIPTVGGIGSLDLLVGTSLVFFPSGEGFGGRVTGFSAGARLGLLRESFTLPGVSLSASRRWVGSATLGDRDAGDPVAVEVDPSITSIRATVGKDLLSVGLVAGWGWDSFGGSLTMDVTGGGTARDDALSLSRTLWFGGASLNFLILQLSAEFGWAAGLDAVPGYMGAPFDPTAGTAFGSVAFRLTL